MGWKRFWTLFAESLPLHRWKESVLKKRYEKYKEPIERKRDFLRDSAQENGGPWSCAEQIMLTPLTWPLFTKVSLSLWFLSSSSFYQINFESKAKQLVDRLGSKNSHPSSVQTTHSRATHRPSAFSTTLESRSSFHSPKTSIAFVLFKERSSASTSSLSDSHLYSELVLVERLFKVMRSQSKNLTPVQISPPMIRGLSAESDDTSDSEISREYLQETDDIPTKALRLLGLSASQCE